MPKECAVCKQPAVVAARITRGEQTANVYLCENCVRRVGKQAKVEVLSSASPSFPKGTVISPPIKNPNSSLYNNVQSQAYPQPPSPASKHVTPPSATAPKLSEKINTGIQSVKSVYNLERAQQAKKQIQSTVSSVSSAIQQGFAHNTTDKKTSRHIPPNNDIGKITSKKTIAVVVTSILLVLLIVTIPNWGKKSQDNMFMTPQKIPQQIKSTTG